MDRGVGVAEGTESLIEGYRELAGIVQSIENLHSFPFVAQAVAAGELALLDSASGEFKTVD